MALCTPSDVFDLALAAPAFAVRPRPVQPADVDAATGRIRLRAHGLSAADAVTFEAVSGGSLPTGIQAFTPYAPTVLSADLFHVGVLSYADVGAGWGVVVDSLRRIERIAVDVTAQIEQALTAHKPPVAISPAPPLLVGIAARMTARAAVTSLQVENAAYRVAVDRLFAQEEYDRLLLEQFLRGMPVQGVADQSPGVADNGARTAYGAATAPNWMLGRIP